MCWLVPAPRWVRAPGPARTSVPFLSFPAWLFSRAALLPTNEDGTVGVGGPGVRIAAEPTRLWWGRTTRSHHTPRGPRSAAAGAEAGCRQPHQLGPGGDPHLPEQARQLVPDGEGRGPQHQGDLPVAVATLEVREDLLLARAQAGPQRVGQVGSLCIRQGEHRQRQAEQLELRAAET